MAKPQIESAAIWPRVVAAALSKRDASPIESLALLVDALRSGRRSGVAERLEHLCDYLESQPAEATSIGETLARVVDEAQTTSLLTESGVPGNLDFATELFQRLERRFVPEIDPPRDLRTPLRVVFHEDDDHRWIDATPDHLWIRLLRSIGIGEDASPMVNAEWDAALRILSHHVASLGLQPQISHRLPEVDDLDSPFFALPNLVGQYLEARADGCPAELCDESLRAALDAAETSRALVLRLREEKSIHGTSLRLTVLSTRLLGLLDRLEHLLELTTARSDEGRAHLVALFHEVVRAENTRNHVRPHLRASFDLLAYQVVEHAAKKGSKYITSGTRDYWKFFVASLGGGLIVALFALVKILLSQANMPVGIEAIVFGVNYSICFVIIYLSGAALATKQPAMTANTLARSLDREDDDSPNLERLESLIVRVWRSQFISFAGNLLMALPVAFLLSEAYFQWQGTTIASEAYAEKLVSGIHPWRSGALMYAGVAGFFLFASGLVAGWVDNRNAYMHLPARIAGHPKLARWFGKARAARAGAFIDRNLGILAGNVVLGFCLGSAGSIGEILGLPFDIRHIAFSSAELGVSVEVLGRQMPRSVLLQSLLGVTLIGLVNFVVSFGLSLGMALESRRLTFRETRGLLRLLGRSVIRRPLEWFFPPRRVEVGGER